ncbi:MAG: hypothetical protein M3144_09895, partial [Actinomycetota bacterium]|nr:hypothetical protein [Actinomycetota bacterium]
APASLGRVAESLKIALGDEAFEAALTEGRAWDAEKARERAFAQAASLGADYGDDEDESPATSRLSS